MRPNLREHLANERTFLAWVRTSIAVIAFGFVLDRFSLYVHYLDPSADARANVAGTSLVGAGLMWLGTVLIPVALLHFRRTRRDIDQPVETRSGDWIITALAVLLTAIGVYLSLMVGRL